MPRGNSESVNSNPGHLWSEDLKFPSRAEALGRITGELKARLLPVGASESGCVVGAIVKPDIVIMAIEPTYIFLSSCLDHTNMLSQSILTPI